MSAIPGDIFEIPLADGFGYVQLRARHAVYGDILDVDLRKYPAGGQDSGQLVFSKTVIFPLCPISNGSVSGRPAGHLRLKSSDAPLFKFAVRDPSGTAIYWWIWNGSGIFLATPDQPLEDLPERRVLSRAELLALW